MKKLFAFTVAAFMLLASLGAALAADLPFVDVPQGAWFYNDVKTAYESGIINGKSDTEYKPSDNMTYAEAIKLAACMNMLATEGKIEFEKGDPWYTPYVDYCISKGIIKKSYDYSEKATRSGYMEIFANCLPDDLLKEINTVEDNSIPDVPSSASYAGAVYKLYRAGILTGVDDAHNCNPNTNIQRSEVAAILTRMNNKDARLTFTMGSAKDPEKTDDKKEFAIKTQPEDIKTIGGKSVVVSIEVEGGTEPYKYQWKGDDSGNGMYAALSEGQMVSGEATKDLQLSFLNKGSIDVICVVMDADDNTLTSEKATVTAEVAELTVSEQPKDVEAKVGERSAMYLTASGGNGSYTYKWEYELEGVWVGVKGEKEFVESANSLNYTPKTVGSVKVRCIITDEDGTEVTSDEASFTVPEVKIQETLEITTQPESVTLEGQTGDVTFTVAVKGGNENNKYQWEMTPYNKSEWKAVPENDFVRTKGTNEASLTITVDDNNRLTMSINKYRCVITDENGESVTSDEVSFKTTK